MGIMTYEVLSGQIPFPHHVELVVMQRVVGGKRLGRPRGTKGAWFMNDPQGTPKLHWAMQPESQPSIETVLECFVQVVRTWKPPSLQGGEEDGEEMGNGVEADEDMESDEDTDTDEDIETDATVETSGFADTDAD